MCVCVCVDENTGWWTVDRRGDSLVSHFGGGLSRDRQTETHICNNSDTHTQNNPPGRRTVRFTMPVRQKGNFKWNTLRFLLLYFYPCNIHRRSFGVVHGDISFFWPLLKAALVLLWRSALSPLCKLTLMFEHETSLKLSWSERLIVCRCGNTACKYSFERFCKLIRHCRKFGIQVIQQTAFYFILFRF